MVAIWLILFYLHNLFKNRNLTKTKTELYGAKNCRE